MTDLPQDDQVARNDLVENAPCALAMLSMQGRVLWSNAAFRTLSGLSKPESSFFDALSRAGAIFFETQLIPIILMRGSVKEVALDLLRGSNERVPVFLSANLGRTKEGANCIRLALLDATERRSYERNLLEARKSAEQLADVVRRALDAIITVSPDGFIQAWNNGAEQTFGFKADEAVGQSFTELLFAQQDHQRIKDAVNSRRPTPDVTHELTGKHKDGHLLDLSMRLTPHLEPPGVMTAFSAIVRDETARRAAERALLQSEKLASVGRLASSIAHEINNPLEAVTNLLFLLGVGEGSEESRGYIRMAQEELARVSQIVTHTLRFHKQATGPSYAKIDELFQSVLTLYRGRLHNSGVHVEIRRSGDTLFCYESEIRQVLVNLFSNAYDAVRPEGGRIELRARSAKCLTTGQPGMRVTVADTGPGISQTVRGHLFEPFVTTKGITGTGLGLWVSHGLIVKNGGRIRVRTRSTPGRSGTVFCLWFPSAMEDHEPSLS